MKISQNQLNSCFSIADVCRLVGWVPSGDNYRRAKELIKDLDTSHFRVGPWNKGKKVKIENITLSLEEILVENSPHKNTEKIKRRLFKEGLKEQKCEICGYTENLELHHINGNPTDNRIENLQILCPNCHAKTNNFRGKNISHRIHTPANDLFLTKEQVKERDEKRKMSRRIDPVISKRPRKTPILCPICNKSFIPKDKSTKYCSQECYRIAQQNAVKRPSFLELIEAFKECKNFTKVGQKYNVTDNAVRKWCKIYQIPEKTKDMQEFIKHF